ncbi:ABC transporter ATP-binding protein/permease [Yinghuangia sp. ASG 101]|uniref:ABC transporter ATP-binding protein n=1 Tax=Yinghuangia sp. ASG 101 TaxID=2896848 RepID=UPI001E48AD82|nr:ABC transporter ATP-binding protein [Yinghuangia sp. ASG 101]UGQ11405.1 ABC transporter ATP-binding protein/permease [Yinghuangia sp. ASG 101]
MNTTPGPSLPPGPTRVVPLDLAKPLGIDDGPATSPALPAGFVRINRGDRLTLETVATSRLYCVMYGRGTSLVGGLLARWEKGDFLVLAAAGEVVRQTPGAIRAFLLGYANLTRAMRQKGAVVSSKPRTPTQKKKRAVSGASALQDLLAPVRRRIQVACLLQAIASVASVVPLVCVVEIARTLAEDDVDSGRVWSAVWVAVAALVLRTVTALAAETITHIADPIVQLSVRRRMAAQLGRVPLGWFDERNSGLVKKALGDDVRALHHLVGHTCLELTSVVVTPLVTLGYLLYVDWRLALIALVPTIVGIVRFSRTARTVRTQMAGFHSAVGTLVGSAVEYVDGIAVVKTFGQAGRTHARFADSATAFLDSFWAWKRRTLGASAAAELAFAPFTTLLVALAGAAALVQAGWLAPMDAVPFVLLAPSIPGPFLAIAYAQGHLGLARLAADSISGVLSTPVLPEAEHPVVPQGSAVEFEQVRFAYDNDNDNEVIGGVDLSLRPGTVTALVGPSGAGKSTLAALLARFWDPTGGRITIGGVDLRDIAADELYRHVGVVLQDVRLLRASVRDNIRLARPEAGADEVEAAARAAGIDERIRRLPDGYDTVLGEAVALSGGEAQRLAIARTLLADTPVIVLDEATAYADPDSEAAVQDAISRLAVGRTLLVIAHRLHTIVGVDRIVVLDHGRIAQTGTHDRLIAEGGLYAELWDAHQSVRSEVSA